MDILKVEHLCKTYGKGENQVKALDDVSFTVKKGEFVAIIGPSGSGKSTLLHILGGVDKPTSGKVYMDGSDVYAQNDDQLAIFRRRQVGLIYQFYNLIPVLNVTENITLPVLMDGQKVNQERLEELLNTLKLKGRENHLPNQLSGGQQQRVSIGRALMNAPAVVLADEPTGNLDSKNSQEIVELLKLSNQKYDQTLIIITHDENIALQADRILAIEDGKITRDEVIPQMSVFQKVTLQTLKKNKTRTIVTIIGIMLSAAMICAVTTFTSSIQNYALQNAIYTDGSWHGRVNDAEAATLESIQNSGKLEAVTALQQLGYGALEGCKNEEKPYLYVLGADSQTESLMPIHITSGRFPASPTEILLPEHLLTNGGMNFQLGDTLELGLGERSIDGMALGQTAPYGHAPDGSDKPETLTVRETRSYTVVGFYERMDYSLEPYSAPGYTAFTLADQPMAEGYRYDLYFTHRSPKEIYDFMKEYRLRGDTNTQVLAYSGVTKFDSFLATFATLAAIIMGLIMFGSVSLIYNAFSISVSERTKQFGLLSSIGATKKQLRKSVLFEAFAVSIIGIPLGIVVGITGIGVTLMLIGNKFMTFGFPVPMTLSVSPVSVVLAALVAVITVLISAWIPSRRAMKVTAVEAIRMTQDVTTKNKKVKTSRLTYKLFGLPGVLASKHYKRNKKKYRATVISLFMSIVLFVSASAFTGLLTQSATGALSGEKYDLAFYLRSKDFKNVSPQELLRNLSGVKNVTAAAYDRYEGMLVAVPKEYLTQEIIDSLTAYSYQPDNLPENSLAFYTKLYFVDDGNFRQLLKEYDLSEAEYMNLESPLAIAVDGNIHFDIASQKFKPITFLKGDRCEAIVRAQKEIDGYLLWREDMDENGKLYYEYRNRENPEDTLKLSYEEAMVEVALTAGKTITERPWFVPDSQSLTFLLPESALTELFPVQEEYFFMFQSDDHGESYDALKESLSGYGLVPSSIYDLAAQQESEQNMITIIQVFAYGFIVLISLIAAANVFNTISTNIGLRRREFAMLKSVGMTAGGFNKMMNYECLLYGSRALLYGLPVSGIISYLMYEAVAMSYDNGFRLPWGAMGIATLSVFAVVFATMLYAMSKIKKDNPIDALKNENL